MNSLQDFQQTFYRERKENGEENADHLAYHIGNNCQSDNLNFGGYCNTWPVADELLDEENLGKYISVQVLLAMFTICPIAVRADASTGEG